MSGPSIEYAIENGIATLTINQPAKMNAMTYDMWLAVPECIAKAEADRKTGPDEQDLQGGIV